MTTPRWPWSRHVSASGSFIVGAGAVSLLAAAPAQAQVGLSATLTTDELYRGVSLSNGDPALVVALAYDGPGGIYAGGSLIGQPFGRRSPGLVGHMEYAGWAGRSHDGPTWDLGVTNTNYDSGVGAPRRLDATEFHLGLIARNVTFYTYYSPDYFNPSNRTLYNEVNLIARPASGWRLVAHAGVLDPLAGPGDHKPRYDLSAGLVRAFKGGETRLAWTTTRPDLRYQTPYVQGRGTVTLSVSLFF
jgi:uncharacterized protein (TIGR02001 family)